MKPPQENFRILRPRRDKIIIKGKISYQESTHAWSLLNLRKNIIEQYPQLRERRSKFGYKMIFFHEQEELEKTIKEIKKNQEPIPILVWLMREE